MGHFTPHYTHLAEQWTRSRKALRLKHMQSENESSKGWLLDCISFQRALGKGGQTWPAKEKERAAEN